MAVINETVTKDLGPVSSYAIAVAEGFQGTRAEWVSYISNVTSKATEATNSALKAEGYASGKQNGVDVSDSSSIFFENNAKYHADRAAAFAASVDAASVADTLSYLGIT